MGGPAPAEARAERSEHRQLVEVVRRFYLGNESKVEIAQTLGLSRFKVARMLRLARERGIVEIRIHDQQVLPAELGERLAGHLGLERAVVVAGSADVAEEREALGAAAARYLEERVSPGSRVGFSWGRTLVPIATHLGPLPPVELVQLTGVVGNDPSQSPILLLARLSKNPSTTAKALIAPLYARSAAAAQALREEPAVAEVLADYDHLDMALLSVGSWQPRVTQLEQHICAAEAQALATAEAVADFGGLFFDAEGRYVECTLNQRRISVTAEQLLRTPDVVAVAGQREKTAAIRAVCCSGLVTALITTDAVATGLLAQPPVQSRH